MSPAGIGYSCIAFQNAASLFGHSGEAFSAHDLFRRIILVASISTSTKAIHYV